MAYCAKCGRQIEDASRFCQYCGFPVTPEPDSSRVENAEKRQDRDTESAAKQGEWEKRFGMQDDTVQDAGRPAGSRGKKIWWKCIAAAAVIVMAAVIVVWKTRPEKETEAVYYAFPELEDAAGVWYDGENDEICGYLINGNEVSEYEKAVAAQNGTTAFQKEPEGEVFIWGSGSLKSIPGPIEDFCISGSGEKIACKTEKGGTYLWDVQTGESIQLSESGSPSWISWTGAAVRVGDYVIAQDGKYKSFIEDKVIAVSSDGLRCYFYYYELDENGRYDCVLAERVNDSTTAVIRCPADEGNLSDEYRPRITAHSADYREIIVQLGQDIYYYKEGEEAKRITGTGGGELIALASICYTSRNQPGIAYAGRVYARKDRPQRRILNNIYLLEKELEEYTAAASLVWLDEDMRLTEVVPDIRGNACLSEDGTKLWCESGGKLVFASLSEKGFALQDSGTAYIQAQYDASGKAKYSDIAAAPDGTKACYIDTEGKLWMCTADSLNHPKVIADDVFWVRCSAEGEFYVLRNAEGQGRELYRISGDRLTDLQMEHVVDVCMTKNDIYVVTEEDGSDRNETKRCLYHRNDAGEYDKLLEDSNSTMYFVDYNWYGTRATG